MLYNQVDPEPSKHENFVVVWVSWAKARLFALISYSEIISPWWELGTPLKDLEARGTKRVQEIAFVLGLRDPVRFGKIKPVVFLLWSKHS